MARVKVTSCSSELDGCLIWSVTVVSTSPAEPQRAVNRVKIALVRRKLICA